MTGRRLGLLALAVVFVAVAMGQEWITTHWAIDDNYLLDLLVGISAGLCGIVALDRRPGNRIGWLLLAIGVAWHAPPYELLNIPTVTVAALLIAALHVPLVGHLVLAYPSGRLQTRFELGLMVTAYATMIGLALARMAFYAPRAWGCEECAWHPAVWPSRSGYATVLSIEDAVTIVLVPGFMIAVALRYVRASRIERRDLLPLWIGATMIAVIEIIGTVDGVQNTAFLALLWQIRAVLLILVPLVFVAGLLTDRTARSAIGELVLRLNHGVPAGQLGTILADSLGDRSLRIVYAAATGDGWVTADGTPAPDPISQQDRNHAVTLIRRDQRLYAALVHDRALSQTLVTGVASAAAMAIEYEWLHAELRAQLEEVRASRSRIVAAGDQERRKVERDLHDGAQQRLLALSLALRSARRQVDGHHTQQALTALDRAEDELKLAIDELRELARGIHPTVLTDEGLPAAVRALAARASVPVDVDAAVPKRLPAGLEATAYFAVSEALANVTKHAGATTATVGVHIENDELCVVITDDGRGGADPTRGSGLRGLRDRVAAAEGTMTVTSPVGAGTRLAIRLPVPVQAAP